MIPIPARLAYAVSVSESSLPPSPLPEPPETLRLPEPPELSVIPPTPGEVITSLATNTTYTMGEQIGEGHFGVVYGCVDVWNNSLAAKVLKPLVPHDKLAASAFAELQKLLLLRHPHITYVFDAFEYRDTFYIITERCHCPLTTLLTLEPYDGIAWLKPVARCILQAVNYVHMNQYAHQDIHLGNVFAAFAKDEMNSEDPGAIQFKLGDLGVAKLFSEIDAANTRAQWMLPPEVLEPSEFGPLDHRIDIYHCGLLFLHLALGKELRFTAEEIRAGRPRELAMQLPAPFNFALEKALRRHVPYRTANAMELWRDLNSPEPPVQQAPEQLHFEVEAISEASHSVSIAPHQAEVELSSAEVAETSESDPEAQSAER
jgi:serine/threonine protein kinase